MSDTQAALDMMDEKERKSIPLTPENAEFYRSAGGLVSLRLNGEEEFERVVLFRCYPVTNSEEFISVREPNSKKMGRGKEIGMIRRIADFPGGTRALFLEELERRYFTPEIHKITSVKDKFGYTYWDAETSAGNMSFILNNPFSNIRLLEDGRILINDLDGNSFQISDPKKLDAFSFKKIEVYI